jgi:hypothetical protein
MHSGLKGLRFRYLLVLIASAGLALAGDESKKVGEASDKPPYFSYFDPKAGFKPAQIELRDVILQVAGSLEAYGSPEPYIRHVMAEHARIDAKVVKATGKASTARPSYLTDAYVENLLAGWKKLEPSLKLQSLCVDSGRNLRYAIMGWWNKSADELVAQENKLSGEEKESYRALLAKPFFKKVDFPVMDKFYSSTFDKLTDEGKDRVSERTRLGMVAPEEREAYWKESAAGTKLVSTLHEHELKMQKFLAEPNAPAVTADTLEAVMKSRLLLNTDDVSFKGREAADWCPIQYSHKIKDAFQARIEHAKKQASPEQAAQIEAALNSMAENLLVIAHSEYEAAIMERSVK